MIKVEYRKVSKHFADGTAALKNFSLQVNEGELVVLVGPSGCGKSTALRLLAGLEDVTSGDILIDGKTVNQITPQQRNIAMVFQNYALYPHMSVRGNLEFPLKMIRTPKDSREAKVHKIAQILKLDTLLDRKPAELSGGQRQRVAMGRALVRNPSVFLLDEPLSNLDAKLRSQIRSEISELQRRLHKTTLYVTHDQVEAMTLGDRVAVLESGKLHQIGTPSELYKHPKSIFVARFIGSPGMNIFASSLEVRSNGQGVVQAGGMAIPLPREKFPSRTLMENRSIFVGIRPETITTVPGVNRVACRVYVTATEFLGHETIVYFRFSGQANDSPLTARLPGQFLLAEEITDLYLSPETLYLFSEDGSALL